MFVFTNIRLNQSNPQHKIQVFAEMLNYFQKRNHKSK